MTIFKDTGFVAPVDARDNLPPPVDRTNHTPIVKSEVKVGIAGRVGLASDLVEDKGHKASVQKTANEIISVVGAEKAKASK